MLFNLFGKKEEAKGNGIFSDKVYIGYQAKMDACVQLAKDQPGTLFIAWFSGTAASFKDFFKQNGLNENRITEARLIHIAGLHGSTPVFIEHYPLHAKELSLVENWPTKNILVFSSMDEPLFRHFGSEKMIPLIKMLGIKENEAIEHAFVTQSIIKGQQKIADKVSLDQSAHSQGEWMVLNLK